ncbi:MAG TPA: Holliday junction branch migration protein RuvA, partial [Roseibacterium sp.]|nr:Holliday junction branch migration protein RuvA [Roseibacterium sp.]
VGYVVHCSDRTLAALPGIGEAVSLYTELLVREDLLQLFGFTTPYEREWHRLLISVQGVGAKASMAILGTLGAEGAARAITLGDAVSIKAAPGVGPKLAQRVVMELKDKAPAVMAQGGSLDATMAAAGAGATAAAGATGTEPADVVVEDDTPRDVPLPTRPTSSAQAEALSALQNLGYAPADAAQAVVQAADGASDTADLIRTALRLLAPKD